MSTSGKRRPLSAAALLVALLLSGHISPASAAAPFTVAFFPLHTAQPPPSSLERIAVDVVTARLAALPHIRLVDGDRLSSIAAELGLKLSRSVSEEDARRIGALAGADIIVTGETSRVESDMVFAVRLIGVASSRVVERYVSGTSMGGIRPLLTELAETIIRTLTDEGADIVSGTAGPAEALSALKARLSGRHLPTLHVTMLESYGGHQRDASAGAEELEKILRGCGFALAATKADADVVIYGSAVGSSAPRRGDLVASEVNVELRSVDISRGELLSVASTRHTAVDIFASLAGSKAFREAVHALSVDFIEQTLDSWQSGRRPLTSPVPR
jgi:hypothetical protein